MVWVFYIKNAKLTVLGRYSIYTWACNVNLKRECEQSNKRVSIVWITFRQIPFRRERETRIYDMWTWNASVKPIATCSDFFTKFTDGIHGRGKNMKLPLSMPEVTKKLVKTIWKCPVLYDQSLKKYRVTYIKDRVLQKRADPLKFLGTESTLRINFSFKTMSSLVSVVLGSMLMTVLMYPPSMSSFVLACMNISKATKRS